MSRIMFSKHCVEARDPYEVRDLRKACDLRKAHDPREAHDQVKYVTYLKVSSCLLKVSWLRADVENRMVGGRLSTSCSQALYIALIYDR